MLLLPSTRGSGVLNGGHRISCCQMIWTSHLKEDKPQLCSRLLLTTVSNLGVCFLPHLCWSK